MSQTSYNIEQNEAYAGMKVDSRFDTIESKLAEVPASVSGIAFGLGLMSGIEDAVNQVRLPSKTQSVLTTDIALEASNSTVITVNGDALTAVVYASSDAATMAAVVAMILTHADVVSSTLTSARVITVVGVNGLALTITGATTGGTNQAVWTPVATDPGVLRGISVHRHMEKAIVTGIANYKDKDSVDVMRKGLIWMPYTGSPTIDTALYINLDIAASEGYATITTSNNIAVPGGVVREINSGLGILKAEINLPQ